MIFVYGTRFLKYVYMFGCLIEYRFIPRTLADEKRKKDPRGVTRSSFPTDRTTVSATADCQDVLFRVDGVYAYYT